MGNSKDQIVEAQIQQWLAKRQAEKREAAEPVPPPKKRRKSVAVFRAGHRELEAHDWFAIAAVAAGAINHLAGKVSGESPVFERVGQEGELLFSTVVAISAIYLVGMMANVRKRTMTISQEMREVER